MSLNFQIPSEIIELSRKDNFIKLNELRTKNSFDSKKIINAFNISSQMKNIHGIYAFWFIGGNLPSSKTIQIKIRDEDSFLNIEWKKSDFIIGNPLYVGKTTNLKQRIRQHIMPNTPIYFDKIKVNFKKGRINKYNSTCQFRAGIELLFDYAYDTNFIYQNVALSFVEIPNGINNEGLHKRFYLEDLAIGIFKPWFNIDSER